jgi:ribose transport system ATP-binding protein
LEEALTSLGGSSTSGFQADTLARTSLRVPRFQAVGVSKFYPGARALYRASVDVYPGEVVGLVGENGAGKTTLFNVMSGVNRPDEGEIRLDGEAIQIHSTHAAMQRGIFRVFQEQGLIGALTVYENLCLGMEERFSVGNVLRKGAMRRHAREALGVLGLSFDVDQVANRLSFSTRQLIEVTRVVAMSRLLNIKYPVALLDEPTAALSGKDLEMFFELVRKLEQDFEASVIFVSHRLDEVLKLSDRVYVMKDGEVVGEVKPTVEERELHRLMVGRDRSADFYCEHAQCAEDALGEVALQVSSLSGAGFEDVSFSVREGEILGIGGLLASGKTELGKAVFGAVPSGGTVMVEGKKLSGKVTHSISENIGYIPIDRHREGILLGMSVTANIGLAAIHRLSPNGLLRPGPERKVAKQWVDKLGIKVRNIDQQCNSLSGGNQQKVVIAKWLASGLKVLIADNPTRGVDAGAKEEIYKLLRELTSENVALLMITDDLVELIGLSNRILIMKDGKITGELESPIDNKPAEHLVVSLMV